MWDWEEFGGIIPYFDSLRALIVIQYKDAVLPVKEITL